MPAVLARAALAVAVDPAQVVSARRATLGGSARVASTQQCGVVGFESGALSRKNMTTQCLFEGWTLQYAGAAKATKLQNNA